MEEISPGQFRIPCASTVHDFAYNRLSLEGLGVLMLILGKLACKHIQGASGMIDSTPISAAIHDIFAEFNPHYLQKMYKLHIFHYGPFPLAALFSKGCEFDGDFALSLSDIVKKMEPVLKKLQLDGGYDSYEIHADLWYKFKLIPLIAYRENAVINIEGTERRIDHWVNRMWKDGGNVHAPLDEKLEFLYKHGRKEQVGAYFRNQNITNQKFQEEYKSRSDCERNHSHMKATCNFTVHGMKNQSKEFYMIRRFVSYQFILLTNIMRGMVNIQNSSCYL